MLTQRQFLELVFEQPSLDYHSLMEINLDSLKDIDVSDN